MINAKVYFVRVHEGQRTVHVTRISSSEEYARTVRAPPHFCNMHIKLSCSNYFIRKVETLAWGVSIHKVAEEKLHKHMASHTSGISLYTVRLPKR